MWDVADQWLIDEIQSELVLNYGLNKGEANRCIEESNLHRLMLTMPEQVHHEHPVQWAKTIYKQVYGL